MYTSTSITMFLNANYPNLPDSYKPTAPRYTKEVTKKPKQTGILRKFVNRITGNTATKPIILKPDTPLSVRLKYYEEMLNDPKVGFLHKQSIIDEHFHNVHNRYTEESQTK